MNFSEIIAGLLEAVYPAICPVCSEVLPHGVREGLRIHPQCIARLKKAGPCSDECPGCESGRSLWLYDEFSSGAVFTYKYDGRRELAAFFALSVLKEYRDWIESIGADAIVPVPISREKKRKRGFNQSELIADIIAGDTGIPLKSGALVRVRSTSPQKQLKARQRRENLRRAFRANSEILGSARCILLIDDIYTTGATIEHCARELRRAGALRVYYLTLCRAVQDS